MEYKEIIEGFKAQEAVSMEMIICCNCGTPFMVTSAFRTHLRESHQSFFCPNGHSQSYVKTDKSKEAVEADLKRKNELLQTAKNEIESLKRTVEYSQGVINREQQRRVKAEKKLKRVDNGVCPHGCKRHFTNLERHIKTKHPDLIAGGKK